VTRQQLYFFICLNLVILAVVVVLTRATPRRIAGALAGAYVILGFLGHGTMWLVAGPAAADRLARLPWEPA